MPVLTPLASGLVQVTFEWDPKHGQCYECGAPAGFYVGETAPGTAEDCEARMRHDSGGNRGCEYPPAHDKRPEGLRCAVCAANNAVDGDGPITRLFPED